MYQVKATTQPAGWLHDFVRNTWYAGVTRYPAMPSQSWMILRVSALQSQEMGPREHYVRVSKYRPKSGV